MSLRRDEPCRRRTVSAVEHAPDPCKIRGRSRCPAHLCFPDLDHRDERRFQTKNIAIWPESEWFKLVCTLFASRFCLPRRLHIDTVRLERSGLKGIGRNHKVEYLIYVFPSFNLLLLLRYQYYSLISMMIRLLRLDLDQFREREIILVRSGTLEPEALWCY